MKTLSAVFWVVLALCLCGQTTAQAGSDIKLHARLVWGTNGDKPNDPKLKDLDGSLTKKLKGVFKWKNYFEVGDQKVAVSSDAPQTVTMSPKCKIEVQYFGDAVIEVKLFGEGKFVVKRRQAIKPDEPMVLAGDSKDDTAWFVVLTRQ